MRFEHQMSLASQTSLSRTPLNINKIFEPTAIGPNTGMPLKQRFPTGGPGPLESETSCWGPEIQFEWESLHVVGCTFFKWTKIYESLQVLLLKRTLSNLIIAANVTNLAIEIAKFVHCFTLQLPHWRWLVMRL